MTINRVPLRLLLVATLFSSHSFAEGRSDFVRGGLGFLVSDGNSFLNPGQMALNRGSAAQFQAQTSFGSGTKSLQAGPSVAYGNGKVGFGGYAVRSGTNLSNSSEYVTTGGATLGMAFADQHLTAGLGYATALEGASSDSSGTAQASLTLNTSKGGKKGLLMGFGGTMSLSSLSTLKTLTFGLGYVFKWNTAFEVNILSNDLDALSDWALQGNAVWAGKKFFGGASVRYNRLARTTDATLRLGVLLNRVDLSLYSSYSLTNGGSIPVGAVARVVF